MSTNAVIQVETFNVYLYKHWDGDEGSTLPFLQKFHKEFLENRGWDPCYETAQLVRHTVIMGEEFDLDDSRTTGWGLSSGDVNTAGVRYIYILKKDGTVEVTREW